jgi:hypothetical protein
MITVSGAIATLIVALGTFLVTRIEPRSWLYSVDVVVLLVGIGFAVLHWYSSSLSPIWSKFMVDLSVMNYLRDGGGTQYTFLETIHHNCAIVLNRKRIKGVDKMTSWGCKLSICCSICIIWYGQVLESYYSRFTIYIISD